MKRSLILTVFLSLTFHWFAAQAQNTKLVGVIPQCTDLPADKKIRLSVSSFDISTINNPGNFGDELAQMLTNALQNTGCFSVLMSLKDMKGLDDNSTFNQTGAADNAPQSGQYKSAQVLVVGKVIEYIDPEDPAHIPDQGGVSISDNARLGFIIQLINASTREIIDSKQFIVDGKKIIKFLGGIHIPGTNKRINLRGQSNAGKSFKDAEQKGIIEAVQYIAAHKDAMPMPQANSGTYTAPVFNAGNCAVLNSAYVPRVMVIIPEYHLTRVRIPDPAGETEINRKMVDAGFRVVDPALYAAIEKTMEFDEAAKDPMKAISLGKRFGADIVIYGEAFSELAGNVGKQISCRARVEVRAVRTDDATIIATNGLEAGAVDIAEIVAGKAALRKAGGLVADYMLTQFCSKNLFFSKAGNGRTGNTPGISNIEIVVQNTDYSKLRGLADALGLKGKIISKSINNGVGNLVLQYTGKLDNITDYIDSHLGTRFSIKDAGNGRITLIGK